MAQYTFEYEIPKQTELAQKFAKEAQYSDDHETVQVGRYRTSAKKDENTLPVTHKNELVVRDTVLKTGVGSVFKIATNDLEQAVAILAKKEAEHHLTAKDRTEALAKALQSELNKVIPENKGYGH